MTSFLRSDRSRAVAIWLFAVAGLVAAMVVVGGATRLTGSGLSITEWRPISGALPPLGDQAWRELFAKYQAIPQYRLVNPDMTLDGFKAIFWWEWAHRLLGRLIGAAYAVPFVIFLLRKQIPQRLIAPCAAMLALGGLQGLVGWWMVASGLTDRVSVAPERLTVHLGLALALFIGLVWTALEAWSGQARQTAAGRWPLWTAVLLAGAYVQSLLGALVAGNKAWLVYNDWPLMNGRLFPDHYLSETLWATIAHNQGAVQLHHRLGGYALFGGALAAAVLAARSRHLERETRTLIFGLLGVVTVQAGLGIATLMLKAPLHLALGHQLTAVLLLLVATGTAWRSRRI